MSKVKVMLRLPHTHEGVAYAPGDKIEVHESLVGWLVNQAVIYQPGSEPIDLPAESFKAETDTNKEPEKPGIPTPFKK